MPAMSDSESLRALYKSYVDALVNVAIDARSAFDTLASGTEESNALLASLNALRNAVDGIAARNKRDGVPESNDRLLNSLRALLSSLPKRTP